MLGQCWRWRRWALGSLVLALAILALALAGAGAGWRWALEGSVLALEILALALGGAGAGWRWASQHRMPSTALRKRGWAHDGTPRACQSSSVSQSVQFSQSVGADL